MISSFFVAPTKAYLDIRVSDLQVLVKPLVRELFADRRYVLLNNAIDEYICLASLCSVQDVMSDVSARHANLVWFKSELPKDIELTVGKVFDSFQWNEVSCEIGRSKQDD